jgi:hypothetical protein
MATEMPALTQLSSLVHVINTDENLTKHFHNDKAECWRRLENITYAEYKYILALLFKRKYFKLNAKMLQLGFIRKYENKNTKID